MYREQFTAWRKSSYSDDDSNCVEVAPGNRGHIGIRDSKNPDGPHLTFTASEWSGFISRFASSREL